MCFIINTYLDDHQFILKYLKDTEVNLNNVLIMTGDFNIRDNDWNPLYSYYSMYANILREIANSFSLELSISIVQVPMRYTDNLLELNLVIDLMFLYTNIEKFNNYTIS